MVSRFAPSPTGYLHLGHAFSAYLAHRLTRQAGGRFLLRHEDIDHTRVRPQFYDAIEEDLHWLGISWDGVPVKQSERRPLYDQTLEQLKALGVLYPCFCTRREIQRELAELLSAPHADQPQISYPGTCRHLTQAEIQGHLAQGRTPLWRLHLRRAVQITGEPTWHDLKAGACARQSLEHMGHSFRLDDDPTLARRDIGTSYHLAVVVDDAAQGVTQVVRGMDLLPVTPIHVILQRLLGYPTPAYLHHPLVVDGEGRRLAKRDQARSIRELRQRGAQPEELMEQAARNLDRAGDWSAWLEP